MRILVTGNLGYIGTVLTQLLIERGHRVTGYDTYYYQGCEVAECDQDIVQTVKDIRDVEAQDLRNIDAIVHLAALSNDPLGELNPALTEAINHGGSIRLARLAKSAGIPRFVYASSQSMYGISDQEEELDEDDSPKKPQTAYAKTKWSAELELKKLGSERFTVVCLRPSTVFGASPRLRCDVVFNNLVASAYTTGRVEIKSDGTPWRPVVHVRDVCSAIFAALEAPASLVANESFNVGIENGNFTVRQLAEAAQRAVEGSSIVFTGEHGPDARTYRVGFHKIFSVLGDYYKPEWDLAKGGRELVAFFDSTGFSAEMFREKCNRLACLKRLLEAERLDRNLRWGLETVDSR